MRIKAALTWLLFAGMLVSSSQAKASLYKFSDLGTLGGSTSYARGINNAGQVVGYSDTVGNAAIHATLWANGTTTDIGTLGGTRGFALAINNGGQIVGTAATTGNSAQHAVLWSGVGHKATDLGTLGGWNSEADAINDAGKVVGWSDTKPDSTGNSVGRATLWNTSTKVVSDLGSLGGSFSVAFDINESGKSVGWSYTKQNDAVDATSWNASSISTIKLGVLSSNHTEAFGINNVGQIVGYSSKSTGFLLTPAGLGGIATSSVTPLGFIPKDINNTGKIVGDAYGMDYIWRAILWDDGLTIDLNSFLDASTVSEGWVLNNTFGINDQGWIVGNASNSILGVSNHAFMLSILPIPEPSSLALLGLALGGLAVARRRSPS